MSSRKATLRHFGLTPLRSYSNGLLTPYRKPALIRCFHFLMSILACMCRASFFFYYAALQFNFSLLKKIQFYKFSVLCKASYQALCVKKKKSVMINPSVHQTLTSDFISPPLHGNYLSCTCLSFMVNVCRGRVYPSSVYRGTEEAVLYHHILMLCSCFYLVS